MDKLLEVLLQNIGVVAKLVDYPTHSIRILSDIDAIVPILSHESRSFRGIQRYLSNDGRERVCRAIDTTLALIEDYIALPPCRLLLPFVQRLTTITQFPTGAQAFARLYETDVTVALYVDAYSSRWTGIMDRVTNFIVQATNQSL